MEKRTVLIKSTEKDNREVLLKIIITGTVFSGNPDTTFANTVRQACFQRFVYEHLLGLSKEDYRLWCKGDDSCAFVASHIEPQKAFATAFSTGNNLDKDKNPIPYGLGMYMKRLTITGPEGYDFCSTHLLYDPITHNCKIIRQLPRTDALNAYSEGLVKAKNKAHAFTLLHTLADECASWATGVPVFEEYIKAYRHVANQITPSQKEWDEYLKHVRSEVEYGASLKCTVFKDDPVQNSLPFHLVRNQRDEMLARERVSHNLLNRSQMDLFIRQKYEISRTAVSSYGVSLISRDLYSQLSAELNKLT